MKSPSTPRHDTAAEHRAAELDAADLDDVRAQLTAEVKRLERAIDEAHTEEIDVREDVGHDEIDDVVTRIDTQRRASDAHDAEVRLEAVHTAIRRIADGSYEVCIDCGGPIGRDRLLALPTAVRCIGCQSRFRSISQD